MAATLPTFRVVTVEKPPFVYFDNTSKTWIGYCIDMLNEISAIVKFNYTIRAVDDYGNIDDDGNWYGMVRELMEGRADIGLGGLAIEAARQRVIDMSLPFYEPVGITIIRKRPDPPVQLFRFVTVFDGEVWLCIIGSYLFTSILMWIFDAYSPFSYQNNSLKYKDEDEEEKRVFTLRECLWFCLTSLTPQGGGATPKNVSGRMVAATWWLFGFIIIASYTANLAATLTISRLAVPVDSLDDLTQQYKIEFAPILNSSEHIYFQRMAHIEGLFYEKWKDMTLNDSLPEYDRAQLAVWEYPVSDKYTKLLNLMEDTNFPPNFKAAINRVRRPTESNEFALIGNAADIKYLMMTNCGFQLIGNEFSKRTYGIGLRKGADLKSKFDDAMRLMQDRHSFEKLREKWWDNNPNRKRCSKVEDLTDGLNIRHVGGVFFVVVIGIVSACLTIILEYYCFRQRAKIERVRRYFASKIRLAERFEAIKRMFKRNTQPVESFRPIKEKKVKNKGVKEERAKDKNIKDKSIKDKIKEKLKI